MTIQMSRAVVPPTLSPPLSIDVTGDLIQITLLKGHESFTTKPDRVKRRYDATAILKDTQLYVVAASMRPLATLTSTPHGVIA